ncbi:hypothetical protein [Actinomadura sp. WAC 06369]|uniref:hypothetical protein n=1 Tax=Actinomadura sp. WAC 06369 TaxID=2203193 RepID=UPI000F7A38A2|nr:hypothetical protein [Actinomadura sp. WAC 06369]RSN72011.1 hypothetical protein DMH08_00375 [Actinomadura sp. WAC 06369]
MAARLAAAQGDINTCARRGDFPFGEAKASGIGRAYALGSFADLRATVHPAGHVQRTGGVAEVRKHGLRRTPR